MRGVLGGGGPQGAFGARLWTDSVGLLSRSGTDIEPEHVQTLQRLQIDLAGWRQFPDIPTPRTHLNYDQRGAMLNEQGDLFEVLISDEDWLRLLAQVISLPAAYQHPRTIHLITEYPAEPMVKTALHLRQQGTLFSLEPIIDFQTWQNRAGILDLLPQVDIVTPDWPSAAGIAGSEDPRQVMGYWSTLGAGLVAVRHGEKGSYVWSKKEGVVWHIPALPVEVVDPTGAGNSYGGGLCVGWAECGEARLAGCYGAVAAKFLITQAGLPVTPPESLRAEAQELLAWAVDAARPL